MDTTNFDNFEPAIYFDKAEILALKLEKRYPEFFKEGYNYKAAANYRPDVSPNYLSVVITVFEGDNEM